MRKSLIMAAFGLALLPLQAERFIEFEPFILVAPHIEPAEDVLERETLQEAKPIDLAEVLASEMPGVAAARRGPLAGDLILRGVTRDNVLITVDDNKTYCACPNRMDPPAFHVSSQQIQRITVRSGPFTVERGGSPGGAVFVETAPASFAPHYRLTAYGASFNTFAIGGEAGGNLGLDDLRTTGGLYYQQGEPYEDGNGRRVTDLPAPTAGPDSRYLPGREDDVAFRVFTGEVKADFDLRPGTTVSLNFGYQDADDVRYPGLRMDAMTDVMQRGSIGLASIVETPLADELAASFALSTVDHDMRDDYRRTSLGAPPGRSFMMRTESETGYLAANLHARKRLSTMLLRYGVDWQRRSWDADNIVGPNTNNMLPDVSTYSGGLWGVMETQMQDLRLELGARLEFAHSKAGQDISFVQNRLGTQTNGQFDALPSAYLLASYDLTETLEAFAGAGHAARLPDPQERYINLDRPGGNPDWVGNPDLDPVRTTELQGGLRWHGQALTIEASAFHAWHQDFIYLAGLPPAPTRATTYENIDARIYGTSIDATWEALDWLSFDLGTAWQEGIKQERPTGGTNNALAEVPPLRGRAAATVRLDNWRVRLEGLFQDDLNRIDPDLNERPLDGWAIMNLNASVQATDWLTIGGGIENVLDETYAVANSFVRDPFSAGVVLNEPGRSFYLRVTASW